MALELRNKQAFDILTDWSAAYLDYENDTNVIFSDSMYIGSGKSEYDVENDRHRIKVGISPISRSFLTNYKMISSSDFVKIGATMFHELAHYSRSVMNDTPKEISIRFV